MADRAVSGDADSLFYDPEVEAACEALFALIEDKMAARGDVFWNAAICVAGRVDGHSCAFGDASPAAQESLADVVGALLGQIESDLQDRGAPDADAAGVGH